jgi:hypothetical protein
VAEGRMRGEFDELNNPSPDWSLRSNPIPVPENGNAYCSIVTLKIGESVQPLAKPETTIQVADLMP